MFQQLIEELEAELESLGFEVSRPDTLDFNYLHFLVMCLIALKEGSTFNK